MLKLIKVDESVDETSYLQESPKQADNILLTYKLTYGNSLWVNNNSLGIGSYNVLFDFSKTFVIYNSTFWSPEVKFWFTISISIRLSISLNYKTALNRYYGLLFDQHNGNFLKSFENVKGME